MFPSSSRLTTRASGESPIPAKAARTSRFIQRTLVALALTALAACGRETRPLETEQPQTPPNGPNDPRATYYENNAYQISQGSRYATWYGCEGCHGPGASGVLDLGDDEWRHGGSFDQVYGFVAHGHSGELSSYGERMPAEQLWQITAYVRDLKNISPQKRRRQALDQSAEPRGDRWSGPLR